MGVYSFARKAFKSGMKENKIYIIAIAISIVVILNAINISYIDSIYPGNDKWIEYEVLSLGPEGGEVQIFKTTLFFMQKQNLFILLIFSAFFAIYCNINSIKRKSKEIAFILANGCSLVDVSRFLLYVNGMSYLYGAIIGILLGIISIPLFNMIMYKLLNIEGKIFLISGEGIGVVCMYIIIQVVIISILNCGFSFRKEIIDLMKVENTITFKDTRNIKTPGVIFFVLFLFPILVSFGGKDYIGVEQATTIGFYIGICGIYGTVKFFIPKVVEKLKSTKLMYYGNRRVFICNFLYTLKKSVIYLVGMSLCINLFTSSMAEKRDIEGMVSNSLFCLISCSIVFTCTFIYNLLTDTLDKMVIYKQLSFLGYDKSQIKDIIDKENILTYTLGVFLPILLLICSIINYVSVGAYSLELGLGVGAVVIVPILIGGVISNIANKRLIMKKIYGDQNVKVITD